MSLVEMARHSAQQANEQRLSGLVEQLEQVTSREISSSQALVDAFQPIVETLSGLLRGVETTRLETQAVLDRLEIQMGRLPDTMNAAASSTAEMLAGRVETLADAMHKLGTGSNRALREVVTGAQRVQSEAQKTMDEQTSAFGQTLAKAQRQMEETGAAQRKALAEVTRAQKQGGARQLFVNLAVGIGSAIATSVLSPLLASLTQTLLGR